VNLLIDKIVAQLALEQKQGEEKEKKALEMVKETEALNEPNEEEKALKEPSFFSSSRAFKALKELKAKKALNELKEKAKKALKEKEEALENARGKVLAFENDLEKMDKHLSKEESDEQLYLLKDAVKKLQAEVEDLKNAAYGIVPRCTLT
jgi:hypothetical protein